MNEKINAWLEKGAEYNASDIFFAATLVPAIRINGQVTSAEVNDIITQEEIDQFRKEIIKDGEEQYQKEGTYDVSYSLPGGLRFRLNFYTTIRGSALVARPVRHGSKLLFKDLNITEKLQQLCLHSRGIILIAGSTGSGKSTTLAAMVNYINSTQPKHILTIEDPIEFLHDNKMSLISQREAGGSGFTGALRSALRENPDVIVVGEMRDTETIRTALNAALTGHLVISTVHTSNTVQSVERIINMFPEQQKEQAALDLGMALIGVIAQRLVPLRDHSGMIPVQEILLGTPTVQKAISERDYVTLEDALLRGSEGGMCTFNHAVFRLFKEKKISEEDALQTVDNKDEFMLLLKGMERGVDVFRSNYVGLTESEDDAKNAVDMKMLLKIAVKKGASDLHLVNGSSPILRINDQLGAMELPPLSGKDIQRLLYSVITPRQRIILEEKRELDFALAVTLSMRNANQYSRFRMNAFYERGSLGVVARVIKSTIPSPETLNLPGAVTRLIEKKQGLILVTGPTGSGKSTTLASLIDMINSKRSAKIITIEDPIEYIHENKFSILEQRELHSDTLSFLTALRASLRQDPDVIMVGEMRDVETIAAALTAAETGHLVFATIHTNSAPQTIDRIVDSFPSYQQNQIRMQLASVLLAVVSQRLLPRIDGDGRIAAFEIMIGTPPIQALIRDGKTFQLQSVIETSSKDGMITLEKYMSQLYEQGLISRESIKLYMTDYVITKEF